MYLNRIKKEIEGFQNNPPVGLTLWLEDSTNFMHLRAMIEGPKDSPYEGGKFFLKIELCQNYPFVAPNISFSTRIYHPNIDEVGRICFHGISKDWRPQLSLLTTLLSLQQLLCHPNPTDPLIPEIGHLYLSDLERFNENAKEWTKLYACNEL